MVIYIYSSIFVCSAQEYVTIYASPKMPKKKEDMEYEKIHTKPNSCKQCVGSRLIAYCFDVNLLFISPLF